MANDDAIELDVNDFKDESTVETQETTTTESSPEETKAPEVADDGFGPESSDEKSEDTKGEESEDESKDETKQDESAESDDDKEDKPRAKNNAQDRIRSLANENRELRQQIEKINSEHYRPATPQELVDQGLDPAQAEIQAFRQEQALRDYNSQIAETTSTMNLEAMQVLHEFPVFDKESPEYDPDFATTVESAYRRVAGIKTDEKTGAMYEVNVLPYDFYKSYVEARKSGEKRGRITGQKATEKQLSAAEQPSSAPPKAAPRDKFLEGFDSI